MQAIQMHRQILTAIRRLRHDMRQAHENVRLDRHAVSEPVLSFWRDHGRDWARSEASPADLAFVAELSARTSKLSKEERQAETLAVLQRAWRDGFTDPTAAFPWDGMNDRLPSAALVAFVEGAAAAVAERQQNA